MKEKYEDIIFNVINNSILIFLVCITLYPFLNIIAISFNTSIDTVRGGDFLQLATGQGRVGTRGHSLKLAKPRYRTSKRNKFYNARIINQWNSLPDEVVTSQSVNIFKNKYDQYETERKRRGTLYEH